MWRELREEEGKIEREAGGLKAKAAEGKIFGSGRRKNRGERWPTLRQGRERIDRKARGIEDRDDDLLQAEKDGAWRVGDTQGKGPAVEVLKFEMRQHKKLLCLFGSGRSSPNSMVQ